MYNKVCFIEMENDYYFDESLLRGTVVIRSDPELLQATALNQVTISAC